MATDFERELFNHHFKELGKLEVASRWKVKRDDAVPLGVLVEMHPRTHKEERYVARVRWTDYLRPPSVKFVVPATGAEDMPTAWPKCYGFRPTSLDICLPWTEEGNALHSEWASAATQRYPEVQNPLQFTLLNVQLALDNSYEGRGP